MPLECVRDQPVDPRGRRLYRRAILVAVVGNALLAVAKGAAAWVSGSSAVLSDAANSLADTFYSLLMAIGLRLAQKPPDEGHPQGHSRFEPLVSLLIAVTLLGTGVAALRESALRFVPGAAAVEPGWPTAVLAGSAALKVIMYLVVRRMGRAAESPAIQASARDNLADVLSSVAALAGVWGSRFVHPLLDPGAGVLVALWILRTVWQIVCENLGYLTGRGASPELRREIAATAASVPGVIGVHQVIADHVGPRLRADIHIDVDGETTLRRAHQISDQVRARVEALSAVDLAFVHPEPVGAEGRSAAGDG